MKGYRPLYTISNVEAGVSKSLPAHLRRGIALRELLGGFGAILRTRPDSLTREEQTDLYARSKPVEVGTSPVFGILP